MDDPNVKIVNTVCPRNCYSACGMQVFVKDGKVIKIQGNKNNPATYGAICQKGLSYPRMISSENRLLYPLKRTGEKGQGQFERIEWDEAADIIHDRFIETARKYGPESILYYVASGNHGSAMQSYAYGFWYQMGGFSTTRGSLCSPAADLAVKYTYGVSKDSAIADIENARLIILWGKNPAYTNFHTMRYINKAVEKGARLVTIDPRRNESSIKSHLHLYPRCGTDGLLAIGIAKFIIERGLLGEDFIKDHTYGFEQYKEMLNRYTLDEICSTVEIDKNEIEKLFELIKETPRFTLIMGKGFQRYSNGGQTARAVCLLPALTGGTGRSGSGLYYSDAQRPGFVWPYFPPEPDKIRKDIGKALLGSDILEKNDPPIKGVWIERANPVTSNPNNKKIIEALKSLDFIVCTEHFMTDTAAMADIVLPTAMFLEENDIISSYGHSYLQLKQKALDSPGECKSDKEIYRLMGKRFGFDMRYLPENDEEILEDVINASGFKTTIEKMRIVPYLFPEYNEIAFSDMKFPTSSGRIEFYSEALHDDWGENPLPVYSEPLESKYSAPVLFEKYPLQLMSAHAKERINSQFFEICKKDAPAVNMHTNDALARGINEGDLVKIFNERGEIFARASVGEIIKPGVINVCEGWWNCTGAGVNALSDDRETDIGHGAAFHNCLVEAVKVKKDNY